MNVRTATLLSVAGVLAAGTAAVAVNTQVLSGSNGSTDVPTQLSLPVDTQVFTVPVAGSADEPVVVSTPTPATDGDIAALAALSPMNSTSTSFPGKSADSGATANLMAFQIGDAAVATVDTSSGVLRVVSIDVTPGWSTHEVVGSGSVRLHLELKSAAVKIEFEAFLSGGEVITSISSTSLTSRDDDDDDDDDHDDDDDDDDDDHDDDDHDDDDHDDDDHDRRDDDD